VFHVNLALYVVFIVSYNVRKSFCRVHVLVIVCERNPFICTIEKNNKFVLALSIKSGYVFHSFTACIRKSLLFLSLSLFCLLNLSVSVYKLLCNSDAYTVYFQR
jgi:hypothetical protein